MALIEKFMAFVWHGVVASFCIIFSSAHWSLFDSITLVLGTFLWDLAAAVLQVLVHKLLVVFFVPCSFLVWILLFIQNIFTAQYLSN
jgi:hypothetical protein